VREAVALIYLGLEGQSLHCNSLLYPKRKINFWSRYAKT